MRQYIDVLAQNNIMRLSCGRHRGRADASQRKDTMPTLELLWFESLTNMRPGLVEADEPAECAGSTMIAPPGGGANETQRTQARRVARRASWRFLPDSAVPSGTALFSGPAGGLWEEFCARRRESSR
jgi:hypothetical protein